MKARTVNHKYLGPRGEEYLNTRAQAFRAVCSCSWVGPARFSRNAAKVTWAEHTHDELREWLADVQHDRALGVDW